MAVPGILMQLARNNPATGKIKQMMGMVRAAQNPQAMMNQLMMNNPQLKQAMDIVNQYNGDANKAFQELARQNGINPQEIMDMLR